MSEFKLTTVEEFEAATNRLDVYKRQKQGRQRSEIYDGRL